MSVTEILSTMAEMEDSNTKIHELSRTLKKAQLQEGRLIDEIADDKVKKNKKADVGILTVVLGSSVLGTLRAKTLILRISKSIGSLVAAASGIIPVIDFITRM